MNEEYLFVYGTLRRQTAAGIRRFLARYGEFCCEGFITGRLYEVDGYPGAVEGGDKGQAVFGEVYRLMDPQALFVKLDEYEECAPGFAQPHEYVRKQIPVTLPDGGELRAWAYLYNRDVSGLEQIGSGDYLLYLQEKEPLS